MEFSGCMRVYGPRAERSSRQESELAVNIRKATSIEEVSPKRKSAASARHDAH
jgi:hypothetical protein